MLTPTGTTSERSTVPLSRCCPPAGVCAETRTIQLFGVFAAAALPAAVPVLNWHPLRVAQQNRVPLLAPKRETRPDDAGLRER